MKLSDFDFSFPTELVALEPAPRGKSRLFVAPRDKDMPFDSTGTVADLVRYIGPNDLVVLNNTKVMRARLIGQFEGGGKGEVFLIKPQDGPKNIWQVMLRPGRRMREGKKVYFPEKVCATVLPRVEGEISRVEWNIPSNEFQDFVEQWGQIPLPPYIKRDAVASDDQNYQTVFAEVLGSVAAPTASLHFNEELLDAIQAKGAKFARVTLHVGLGTFAPVQEENVEKHPMHSEWYHVSNETAQLLIDTKKNGHKIWAIGTTSARVVETFWDKGCVAGSGWTNKFILPGYQWQGVDGLLTNFHWPKSTLFMLVSSLLGKDRAQKAYGRAMAEQFRLFSYGDAMLIY